MKKIKIKMWQVGRYAKDTVLVFRTSLGNHIYKDNRDNSRTKGLFFDKYPGAPNCKTVKV